MTCLSVAILRVKAKNEKRAIYIIYIYMPLIYNIYLGDVESYARFLNSHRLSLPLLELWQSRFKEESACGTVGTNGLRKLVILIFDDFVPLPQISLTWYTLYHTPLFFKYQLSYFSGCHDTWA